MRLRDIFYLRYGLFMDRTYGRTIAYIIEFLIVAVVAMIALFIIVGTVRTVWSAYVHTQEAEQRVKEAKKEAADYQSTLLICLNGGLIGHTTDGEYIGCEKATSFRLASKP